MDNQYEKTYAQKGFSVCGVDEVGRGPWAGPVTAAAVIADMAAMPTEIVSLINDSKKLSAKKRNYIYNACKEAAWLHVGIGEAHVQEIDSLNIRNATFLAMERAAKLCREKAQASAVWYAVDGNALPSWCGTQAACIIKGDGKVLSIALASIIAKVTRDAYMAKLHESFPHYGWDNNAGYGTAAHRAGLEKHGVTPHHRLSFKPIHAYAAATSTLSLAKAG